MIRRSECWTFLLAGIFTGVFAGTLTAAPSKVEIRKNAQGQFQLIRDGQPYFIQGAGGSGSLDLLKASGGNTVRSWGAEQLGETRDGKPYLDRLQELGIGISAGIWVKHQRHGFNYGDPAQVEKQRRDVRDAVTKYKDHPAILVWGLGNEMEGPTDDGSADAVWKEVEVLAGIIKQIDPNHPVMVTIAGAQPLKIKNMIKYCPSVDILGVNAYASAPGVGKAVVGAGWTKPFVLTEFGPVGHWEVPKTPWGAPIEATSAAKAASYYTTQSLVVGDSKDICLGTFAFVWGSKQETTSTWYGMLLKSGEKLPQVDAMTYAWTGKWPENRCPKLTAIRSSLAEKEVGPGQTVTAEAEVVDPNGDPLTFEWTVTAESTDRKVGGDAESVPPSFPECLVKAEGKTAEIRTPAAPGAYRLFLVVKDGKGSAATANIPFLVKK